MATETLIAVQSSALASNTASRSHLPGEDAGDILSYYHSSLADQVSDSTPSPTHLSHPSTSSSATNYSPDSSDSEYSVKDEIPKSRLRHRRTPSQGGADRRRLHIVQTDSSNTSPSDFSFSPSSHSSVRSRRGIHTSLEGISLVAPPDIAHPSTYAQSNPPATAPLPIDNRSLFSSHTRAASDIPLSGKHKNNRSREAILVASGPCSSIPENSALKSSLKALLSQHPQSSSPSSSVHSDNSTTRGKEAATTTLPSAMHLSSTTESVTTPEIGQEKDISYPVAAPVIVSLDAATLEASDSDSSPFISSQAPSAFLRYQPGVHSMAGPLPEPPRASTVIKPLVEEIPLVRPSPRPRSPPRPADDAVSRVILTPSEMLPDNHQLGSPVSIMAHGSSNLHEPVHQREGAFPPSVILSPQSTPSSAAPTSPMPPMSEVSRESSPSLHGTDRVSVDSSYPVSVDSASTTPDSRRRSEDVVSSVDRHFSSSPSRSPPSSYHGHTTLSSPKGSKKALGHGLPSNLAMNMKRFSSLPRTPSGMTLSSTAPTVPPHPPHPYSEPLPTHKRRRPERKLKSKNPPAMSCADITTKKSSMERCILYARKINELYIYDCGLSDWVIEKQLGGLVHKPSSSTAGRTSGLAVPGQTRQISRGSMISHATGSTFPQRPDGTKATDMSQPTELPPSNPPILPYPSLAHSPQSTISSLPSPSTTNRALFLPSSNNNSKSGGFFSSLGRKTSVRRDKHTPVQTPPLGAASSGGKLLKSPPPTRTPIAVTSSPSVPGGPRALPSGNRAKRSHTYIIGSPSSSGSQREGTDKRTSLLGRRPSMISSPTTSTTVAAQPRFADNLGKLTELLPHADKTILSAYLRRAGEPMLAIGQYLEDEKQGQLRID